jgi:hypothetical protein
MATHCWVDRPTRPDRQARPPAPHPSRRAGSCCRATRRGSRGTRRGRGTDRRPARQHGAAPQRTPAQPEGTRCRAGASAGRPARCLHPPGCRSRCSARRWPWSWRPPGRPRPTAASPRACHRSPPSCPRAPRRWSPTAPPAGRSAPAPRSRSPPAASGPASRSPCGSTAPVRSSPGARPVRKAPSRCGSPCRRAPAAGRRSCRRSWRWPVSPRPASCWCRSPAGRAGRRRDGGVPGSGPAPHGARWDGAPGGARDDARRPR